MRVRHPQFDFSDVPTHWAAGDPILTHLLNAFHVVIPEGEQFFIRTVRETAAQLADPRQKALARAFIGQEAWHQHAHRGFWERLRGQGLAIDRFERVFHRVGVELLEQRLGQHLSLRKRLAVTAALEHYTAVLSQLFFEPDFPAGQLPAVMRELHQWHAAEELEHRAVAHDLLQEIGGSYADRSIGFAIASLLVGGFAATGFLLFAASDRQLLAGLHRTRPVSGRLLRPARLLRTTAALLRYLRPGFRPDSLAEPQAATAFLQRMDTQLSRAS